MVVHANPSRAPSVPRPSRVTRFLTGRATRLPTRAIVMACGLLVATSGAIHLYLWQLAYRDVTTIGPLFLLQFALSMLVAIALIAWRSGAAVVVGFGLAVGTLIAFGLALTVGLFGFSLSFWSGWATLAFADELVITALLAYSARSLWQRADGSSPKDAH